MYKFLLGLVLSLASMAASADMIARQGRDFVVITDAPCHAGIVSIAPEGAPKALLRRAYAEFNGTKYEACYFNKQGIVFLIYEDGDGGFVPREAFIPLRGA